MRTLIGNDGRFYRNELCFDTTNGETVASEQIKKLKLNQEEKIMLELWTNILDKAKKTDNYNQNLTYGLYQISDELNEFVMTKKGRVYLNPKLNGNINTLKEKIKSYYNNEIVETLFKYELIK